MRLNYILCSEEKTQICCTGLALDFN